MTTMTATATEAIASASVGSLKKYIARAGLQSSDCIEKNELTTRAQAAWMLLRSVDGLNELASAAAPRSSDRSSGAAGIHCRPDLKGTEHPAYNDFARASRVQHVEGLLTDDEILSVHALADTVGPHQVNKAGKLNWKTSYLNSMHHFSTHLPALKAKLIQAARDVDARSGWNVLSGVESSKLGVRVAEHHTVGVGGCLPWIHHRDIGSLVTIDVMLSAPEDFEGGRFQTSEVDGTLTSHTGFEHGDALFFISHKPHNVAPVRR